MKALIEVPLFKQIASDHGPVGRRRTWRQAERVVIRGAAPADRDRLERLASLDSAPTPVGPMLVAERDGTLVAALPLAKGRAIADPFEPSADVVRLLELRRSQLRPAA